MRFSTLYTMGYGFLLCLSRCLVPYRPPQSIAKLLMPVLPVVGQYISVKMTKILATPKSFDGAVWFAFHDAAHLTGRVGGLLRSLALRPSKVSIRPEQSIPAAT
jgi:hypothetical protein